MVEDWSMLPGVVVEASTIVAFQKLYGRHVDMQELEGCQITCRQRRLVSPNIMLGTAIVS